jgi:DNA repair exonuclease SbcCD ATPase subunit
MALTDLLERAASTVASLAQQAADSQQTVTELSNRAKSLDDRIHTEAQRNQTLMTELAEKLDHEHTELGAKSDAAKTHVETLKTKTATAADAMTDKLAAVQKIIEELTHKLEEMKTVAETETHAKDAAVQATTTKVEALHAKIGETEQKVQANVQAHVEKHDTAKAETEQQQAQQQGALEGFLGKLTGKAQEFVQGQIKLGDGILSKATEINGKITGFVQNALQSTVGKFVTGAVDTIVSKVPVLGQAFSIFKGITGIGSEKILGGVNKIVGKVTGIVGKLGKVGGVFKKIGGFFGL